ncbi:hypothetical protein SAMN05421736_101662 [Evansella caseinilytica]|uniref:Uncharacterized protein n=1 Tax=Evansella caseinilytica TaxID=1503961 RepID=A0A1H3HZ91_9BACI|nr:hypothetical protein SAMN05421736_101662 [Evansella caseinilytica]
MLHCFFTMTYNYLFFHKYYLRSASRLETLLEGESGSESLDETSAPLTRHCGCMMITEVLAMETKTEDWIQSVY